MGEGIQGLKSKIQRFDLKSQTLNPKGRKRTGMGCQLDKKHGVQETNVRGFDMGDILHDSVLVDMTPDLESDKVTLWFDVVNLTERLRFNIGCAPEIYQPEIYDKPVLYKFVFEGVSELVFMAGGPGEREPEKRNILTTSY